jgi:hypothetical protein
MTVLYGGHKEALLAFKNKYLETPLSAIGGLALLVGWMAQCRPYCIYRGLMRKLNLFSLTLSCLRVGGWRKEKRRGGEEENCGCM